MKSIQAFFYIETQWDNLGDALINRELIRLMAAHADVTLGMDKVPESFREMMGSQFLKRYKCDDRSGRTLFLLKVLLQQIKGKRCYVFLSPGGWIGELDGRLNLRSWSHTALYYFLKMGGVRLCQLGVSYEDIGPKLELQLRARSRAMYRHYVRDEQSRAVMQACGVRIDGLCPDLAFNAFHENEGKTNPEGVTFSFRAEQYKEQVEDIKNFISAFFSAYGTSRPVYFVSQVKKDEGVNRALAQWVSETYNINATTEDASYSIDATEKLYCRSNVVVSNRLHVLLLAGCKGNAMIAAPVNNHNKKIISLFKDMGLEEHVFESAERVHPETIKRVVSGTFNGATQRELISSCVCALFGD